MPAHGQDHTSAALSRTRRTRAAHRSRSHRQAERFDSSGTSSPALASSSRTPAAEHARLGHASGLPAGQAGRAWHAARLRVPCARACRSRGHASTCRVRRQRAREVAAPVQRVALRSIRASRAARAAVTVALAASPHAGPRARDACDVIGRRAARSLAAASPAESHCKRRAGRWRTAQPRRERLGGRQAHREGRGHTNSPR